MGMNECGVAIGYEAVFTRLQENEKLDGVIPPDMLRLALERGKTAREAVNVITAALKEFGQGGNCELSGNSHFDGTYMVTDRTESWILETSGRQWVTKRVQEPVKSISNYLSIRDDWDDGSLINRLDWSSAYGEPGIVASIGARERQASSYNSLTAHIGKISVKTAFDILRQHGEDYHPATASIHRNVCVHAGPQKDRAWQATGAMVFDIGPDSETMWFTGTSGTCVSIFKPIFPGIEVPNMGPMPTELYNGESLWWKHELLHRRAMAGFPKVVGEIRDHFDMLETEFLDEARKVERGTASEKRELVEHCYRKADEATKHWLVTLSSRTSLTFSDSRYRDMWTNYNNQAGLVLLC